jgi:hypothetical protein
LKGSGKIISREEGMWKDIPFNESPEVIGGYYHLLANDLDEAMEIARRNPEFEFNKDTSIEVRPIKMKEETTGFVYPAKKN